MFCTTCNSHYTFVHSSGGREPCQSRVDNRTCMFSPAPPANVDAHPTGQIWCFNRMENLTCLDFVWLAKPNLGNHASRGISWAVETVFPVRMGAQHSLSVQWPVNGLFGISINGVCPSTNDQLSQSRAMAISLQPRLLSSFLKLGPPNRSQYKYGNQNLGCWSHVTQVAQGGKHAGGNAF